MNVWRMTRESATRLLVAARARYQAHSHIILPLAIFAMTSLLYGFNVRLFSPLTFSSDGIVVGDTKEVVRHMRQLSFDGDMMKHSLFSATTAPLVGLLQDATSVSQSEAIVLVLAMVAALNITGVFILLRTFFSAAGPAFLFTFVFAAFFSNLVLFSIPETYALSDLLILLYLSVLLRVGRKSSWPTSLGLSLLAALASLYNPPLLSLMTIHMVLFYNRSKRGPWIRSSLANLALGGLFYLSMNLLIHGSAFLGYLSDYGGRHFSPLNLLHWSNMTNVFVNFFMYSILSPVGYLPGYLRLQDFSGYLQAPLRCLLLIILESAVFGGIVVAVTRQTNHRRLAVSLLSWILLMLVFYTCYTPRDATLWSLQILLPLMIILAIAFNTIQIRPWVKSGAVLVVSALVAVNNCLAFYAGPVK